MKKKDKNFAGILALFFGWLGIHRYYLGQKRKGMIYSFWAGMALWVGRASFIGVALKFLWVPIIMIVSIIDAVTLFAMDQKRFDDMYNSGMAVPNTHDRRTDFERPTHRQQRQEEQRTHRQQRREHRQARREAAARKEMAPKKKTVKRANPYKKKGVEKFNDYDYLGAIEDFKKSLEIAPNDIATHFNLSCSYSLTENAEQAFYHLDKAVKLGFRDFKKIKEHHALAYLRIQDAFDEFEENGFKLPTPEPESEEPKEDLLNTQPDLLDQLKKLGDLRKNGLLTELEFEQQKKKLLG